MRRTHRSNHSYKLVPMSNSWNSCLPQAPPWCIHMFSDAVAATTTTATEVLFGGGGNQTDLLMDVGFQMVPDIACHRLLIHRWNCSCPVVSWGLLFQRSSGLLSWGQYAFPHLSWETRSCPFPVFHLLLSVCLFFKKSSPPHNIRYPLTTRSV